MGSQLAQHHYEVNVYVYRPDDGVYKDAETCSHVQWALVLRTQFVPEGWS
jgi:hypothetical protein